jgi:predicted DNA-binding antitoxin AbrB/MazE fold protein
MLESVIKAKHIKDYKVWIAFDDGKEGEIDLTKTLKNRNGVFKPLQDINFFKNFKIENDTLSWENGADLAPESLYELLEQQNKK